MISSMTRLARFAGLFALLACVSCLAIPATGWAQTDIPPPKHVSADENGVDLIGGGISFSETVNSIGPAGPGSISAVMVRRDPNGVASSLKGYLQVSQSSDGFSTTLVLDGHTQTFSGAATHGAGIGDDDAVGVFSLITDDGHQAIQYWTPDGRRAIFEWKPDPTQTPMVFCNLLKIIYPTGEVLTFSPTKVVSSLGYVMFIGDYAGAGTSAGNRIEGNCDDLSCVHPYLGQADLGRATVVTTTGDATNKTITYTSPAGDNVRTYVMKNGGLYPGDVAWRVKSVTRAGQTWNYAYTFAQDSVGQDPTNGIVTTTATAPDGVKHIVSSRLSSGHVISETVGKGGQFPNGFTTTFTYTDDTSSLRGFGQLKRVTNPELDAYEYTWDAWSNISSRTHYPKPGSAAAPTTVSASFSCHGSAPIQICNQPDWIKDENGNQTDFLYDPTHGGVTSVTRPSPVATPLPPNTPASKGVRPQTRYLYQQVTAFYQDRDIGVVSGAPVWRVKSTSACASTASCAGTSSEIVTEYAYEDPSTTSDYQNARLTSKTVRAGDYSVVATTTYTYDARGNVIATDGPVAGSGDTVYTHYDASRWITGTVAASPAGQGSWQATKTDYRADGQARSVSTGTVWNVSDDAFINGFTSLSSVSKEYDTNGRLTTETKLGTDSQGFAQTQYAYDALGRQQCVAVRINKANFADRSIGACLLRVSGADGPDRITRTEFDDLGRVATLTSGYGLVPGGAFGGPIVERAVTYTANGQVQTETDGHAPGDGLGNVTSYKYDDFDRLQYVYYPSATTPGQSNSGDFEKYDYDLVGNRVSTRLRDATTTTTRYDNLNRPSSKTIPSVGTGVNAIAGATYTYDYDNFDHQTSAADGSTTVSNTYDALGRMTAETGPVGRVAYQYDAAGRRTRLTWPDTSFYITYKYNDADRLTDINSRSSSLATFVYDDLGHRKSITRVNMTTTSYDYDAAGRLANLTQTPSSPGDSVAFTLQYNAASQITQRTISNSAYAWAGAYTVDRNYVNNGLNQVTAAGAVGYGYDGRGNLQTDNSMASTYLYDSVNRLRGVAGGAQLLYDAVGRLYQSTTSGTVTRYLYDGANVIGEYSGSNVLLRRYVQGLGGDEPLARYNSASSTSPDFFLADHQGSIVATVNSSGYVLTKNTYDEYGAPGSGNQGLFQYTGQMYLSSLALYHYKARAYSPTLGRFLQTDPTGYDDGLNWYAYVGNDPLNGTDPTGQYDWRNLVTARVTVGANGTKSYQSADLLRALVPGQASFDRAVTAGLNGDRVGAVVSGAASVGEIALTVASAGASKGAGAASSAVSDATGTGTGIGKFAGGSIEARSASQTFNTAERRAVNEIGAESGCHTCGTTNPGTKSGNFVPDHQPPSSINPPGNPQRLYPQCLECSREQGLALARAKRLEAQ